MGRARNRLRRGAGRARGWCRGRGAEGACGPVTPRRRFASRAPQQARHGRVTGVSRGGGPGTAVRAPRPARRAPLPGARPPLGRSVDGGSLVAPRSTTAVGVVGTGADGPEARSSSPVRVGAVAREPLGLPRVGPLPGVPLLLLLSAGAAPGPVPRPEEPTYAPPIPPPPGPARPRSAGPSLQPGGRAGPERRRATAPSGADTYPWCQENGARPEHPHLTEVRARQALPSTEIRETRASLPSRPRGPVVAPTRLRS